MKTRIIKQVAITLPLALLLGTSSVTFGAANPNPGILPLNSSPNGKSYGGWAVAWWQWVLSIPAAQNPMLDTTGQYAGVNQSGPVWFLESTFGNSAERTITIPAGKSIFVPVQPWIFGSCSGDCDPSNPGVACDVPTLRDAAASAATSLQTAEVTIDGVALKNVLNYRAISPSDFSVTLPDANVLQALGLSSDVAGTYAPQVADGHYLMLTPLTPGNHTIQIHIVSPDFGIDATVISHLVIK